jgi:hypothetical protein
MKKQKPVVVIGVEGGVASYQAVPPGSVEVVLIDWDDLKEGSDPKDAKRNAEDLLRQIKALKAQLPDKPKGYLAGILQDLRTTLGGINEDVGAKPL